MTDTTDDTRTHDRQLQSASGTAVGARAPRPNPQGKGLVGFLQDWDYSTPRGVVAKPAGRLLADYFTSLLVLSAEFKFKPAFGQTYHLYRTDSRWILSLVSPNEWNTREKQMGYVGACVLHDDSTWSIEPSDNLGRKGPVSDALADVYDGFVDRLRNRMPLEDGLPVYEGRMPYYQRLFAAALSRSINASLVAGDQTGRPLEPWLASLPGDVSRLLGNDQGSAPSPASHRR